MTDAAPDPRLGPQYAKRGMYGEALFSANVLLASDDTLVIAWRLRGEALFGLARYLDAEAAFARAAELDGVGGVVARGTTEWRALCFAKLGEIARAQQLILDYFNSGDTDPGELLELQSLLCRLHEQVLLKR